MGIYDRDYYRESLPRGGFGHFSVWSVTTWLIVVNVAVFFADGLLHRWLSPPPDYDYPDFSLLMLGRLAINWRHATDYLIANMGPLERWGYFSVDTAIYHGQIWRFVTFQFMHASVGHLVGNMIGLFFFGPIVEAHFGRRRYLTFYLLCGLTGAACFTVLSLTSVLHVHPIVPLVGASGGIFGLLVAAAMIAPNVQVFDAFMPITIGMLALAGILLAAYAVFATGHLPGNNAGGEAAHLGGALLGFLVMKNQHWLDFVPAGGRHTYAGSRATRRPRRRRAFQKDWSKDMNR